MSSQTPGPSSVVPPLSDAAVGAVRVAMASVGAPHHDSRELRAAVCALAREARLRDITPERLLVCLKAVWQAEASAHPVPDRRSQSELFEEMVSLCIREYFA
jgi:hypothetical protein